MNLFSIYLSLVKIRIKGQTAYRKSFLIEIVGQFLGMGTHIGGIFFLFHHVNELAGWTSWEVLFLYGITSLGFAVAQLGAESFEDLHLSIRTGEFDRMIIRPVSPLIQIAASSFRIERLGGVFQSLGALGLAGFKTGAFGDVSACLMTGVSVFSMALVYFSLFLANGALSFWTLESSELFSAFTYGGVEVSKYPLSVYRDWMQGLFLFFIPLGFVSYLPAASVFGKQTHVWTGTSLAFLAPVVAVAFYYLVRGLWELSLRHYQSTGS